MADSKIQQFRLLDVSCASCVQSIENALSGIVGIEQVQVNFAQRLLIVTGDVAATTVIAAVKQAGYATALDDNDDVEVDAEQVLYKKLLRKMSVGIGFGVILLIAEWTNIVPPLTQLSGQLIWIVVGILVAIAMWYCGGQMFRNAWQALKHHTATMDSLIVLGTSAAWIYSMLVSIYPAIVPLAAQHVYFEAAIMIIGFITLGNALEIRVRGKTSKAINRLFDLQAKTATLVEAGEERQVPLEQLKIGDIVRVKPGEKVASDGVITEGHSNLDESMITGEPLPTSKKVGDNVTGATLNKSGSFLFKVTRIGEETTLARIIQLVQNAQNSKPKIAKLADSVAAVFAPAVLIIAIVTALIWLNFGPSPVVSYMIVTAMSVLVIACPCALGLASPISVMIGMGKAAEFGVLIRNGEALQLANHLQVMLLDKTGTITAGQPAVIDIQSLAPLDENSVLHYAASIEQSSEHPLANALLDAGKKAQLKLSAVADFKAIAGYGVSALIDNKAVLLGNDKLMQQQHIDIAALQDKANEIAKLGQTPIYLAVAQQAAGLIAVADPIKPDSKAAIQALQQKGIEVVMLTGDNETTAHAVAAQVGIKQVEANVLPEDKNKMVKKYQAQGAKVGMVGDGINDAPALVQANVGFAIGSGVDVAIESADVTLMNSSLMSVANAIAISHATLRNIKQNLYGAFIYNVLGIPIAAGVLFPFFHFLLNPLIGALAMALSSVTVVSNANRLRLFSLSIREDRRK